MPHQQEPTAGSEDTGNLILLAVLALFVGAGAGLTGALFRLALTRADALRNSWIAWAYNYKVTGFLFVVAACTAAAACAAWLVRRFAPLASGSGIPDVEAVLQMRLQQPGRSPDPGEIRGWSARHRLRTGPRPRGAQRADGSQRCAFLCQRLQVQLAGQQGAGGGRSRGRVSPPRSMRRWRVPYSCSRNCFGASSPAWQLRAWRLRVGDLVSASSSEMRRIFRWFRLPIPHARRYRSTSAGCRGWPPCRRLQPHAARGPRGSRQSQSMASGAARRADRCAVGGWHGSHPILSAVAIRSRSTH
jgi:Chloride channel protein EriC